MQKKYSLGFAVTAIFCLMAITIYLIHEPARSHETWMKWFFGRLFLETGEFLTPSRSTLYAVYTSLFLPLGYPVGPIITRVLDTAFIFSGLYVLFRPYTGPILGLACALVWLPGMLQLGAAVNGLAFASLFWAYAFRRPPRGRAEFSLSYAFLILACMFRPNFTLLIPIVILYDVWRLTRGAGFSSLVPTLRPRRHDWPLALVLCASFLFTFNQSDHRWNNGWYIDLTWFGVSPNSLSVASQVGTLVQWTIISKHKGDFNNHDIYFVVKEEFGEVNSLLDVITRYDLYLGVLYSNKQILHTISMHTDIGRVLYHAAIAAGSHKLAYPVFYMLLLVGMIGFYRSQTDTEEKRHFVEILGATIFLTLPLLLVAPSARYTLFLVPLFGAAGLWYGHYLLDRVASAIQLNPGWRRFVKSVVILIPFILLSNGTSRIVPAFKEIGDGAAWDRPYLVKEVYGGHFQDIVSKLKSCKGIMMTNQATFIGAFTDIPIDRVYSIFEIPPFGRLGDKAYNGLRPDRIDCLLMTPDEIEQETQSLTTTRSRYLNYVVPYIEYLKSKGANTYRFDVGPSIDVTVLK